MINVIVFRWVTFVQHLKEHQRVVRTFDTSVSVLAKHVLHEDASVVDG